MPYATKTHPDDGSFRLEGHHVLVIDNPGFVSMMVVDDLTPERVAHELDVQTRTFPQATVYLDYSVESVCGHCSRAHEPDEECE